VNENFHEQNQKGFACDLHTEQLGEKKYSIYMYQFDKKDAKQQQIQAKGKKVDILYQTEFL